MVARLLLFVFCSSPLAAAQDQRPPYSQPPKLEIDFSDDFEKDSRADYQINGDEGIVTWLNGNLTLGNGAILQRKMDADSWVEMKLDLDFPDLKNDKQSSELKIWLDFDEATDSHVWFRQKRENGITRSVIFVVDTSGDWSTQSPKQELISKSQVVGKALENGVWTISYRQGLWKVSAPNGKTRVLGYINNGSTPCKKLVITSKEAAHRFDSIDTRTVKQIDFDLPQRVRAKIEATKVLNQKAIQHYQAGNLSQAISIAKTVRRNQSELLGNFHPDYATYLNNLAAFFARVGDYQRAEPLYVESKTITEKVQGREHPSFATSLNNLASLYQSMGSYDEAEPLYLESIKIREKVFGEKGLDYAGSLNNLAHFYSLMGDLERAEPYYLKAKAITKNSIGQKTASYALILTNLASLYQSMGDLERAEGLFLESMAIYEAALGQKHPNNALNLNNLAGLYRSMGDYAKAEPLYLESKAITGNSLGKENPEYATILANLAQLYLSMGDQKQAMSLYLEAKEIRERTLGKRHPDYARSLDNLARVYESMGKHELAKSFYQEAITVIGETLGKRNPDYALGLNNLAGCYLSLGDYEKAEPLFIESKAIAKNILGEQHPEYAHSLNNLAVLYFSMGNYEQAESLFAASLRITRHNFDRYSIIQSERLQRQFTQSFDYRFSGYIANALKLENRGEAVWNQAADWKGIALIRQKQNLTLSQLPATKEIFAKLKRVKTRISTHFQKGPTSKGWKKRMSALADQEEKLEKKFFALAKQIEIRHDQAPFSHDLLPKNTCLIDLRKCVVRQPNANDQDKNPANSHYVALIMTNDGDVQMTNLGRANVIDYAIGNWLKTIERANKTGRVLDSRFSRETEIAGKELRKLIWDPLEKHINDSELVIVSPDAGLGRFPMIALPGKKPGTYLLEERKIVYAPVPGLLTELLSSAPITIDSSTQSLLVGGIDYGKTTNTDKRLLAYRNRRILGELAFSRLANTTTEIQEIKKRLENTHVLSSSEATEQCFKKLAAQNRILHIATHGFFRSPERFMANLPKADRTELVVAQEEGLKVLMENPNMLSGLAFANANTAPSKTYDEGGGDGVLYSAEIALIPMDHVELAVLSACETGLGTDNNLGEGLIGIQRAFQIAGAKSTIASYWKVNDQATQLLMNKFYENLLKQSKNPNPNKLKNNQSTIRIDALRDAQLWMLNNPVVASTTNRGKPVEIDPSKIKTAESTVKPGDKQQRTHPLYWAAFMLSGDWR